MSNFTFPTSFFRPLWDSGIRRWYDKYNIEIKFCRDVILNAVGIAACVYAVWFLSRVIKWVAR